MELSVSIVRINTFRIGQVFFRHDLPWQFSSRGRLSETTGEGEGDCASRGRNRESIKLHGHN